MLYLGKAIFFAFLGHNSNIYFIYDPDYGRVKRFNARSKDNLILGSKIWMSTNFYWYI